MFDLSHVKYASTLLLRACTHHYKSCRLLDICSSFFFCGSYSIHLVERTGNNERFCLHKALKGNQRNHSSYKRRSFQCNFSWEKCARDNCSAKSAENAHYKARRIDIWAKLHRVTSTPLQIITETILLPSSLLPPPNNLRHILPESINTPEWKGILWKESDLSKNATQWPDLGSEPEISIQSPTWKPINSMSPVNNR